MSVNVLQNGKFVQIAGSVSNDLITGVIEEAVKQAVEAAGKYTDEIASKVGAFSTKVVGELPTEDISTSTIYFIPRNIEEDSNVYDEYMYIRNKWEKVGSSDFNKDNYYSKSEVITLLNNYKYKLPLASETTVGGVMVDGQSITVTDDGTISISDDYLESMITDANNQDILDLFK